MSILPIKIQDFDNNNVNNEDVNYLKKSTKGGNIEEDLFVIQEDEKKNKKTYFLEMLLSAIALMIFFILYGIIQERIMTQPYLDKDLNEVMFKNSAFLVLNNRIVAILGAAIILLYKKESMQMTAPIYKYFSVSFSNTLSTYCQYEALKYVSFPTQTLGKCGKTIPVLILGTFIFGKKKYQEKDLAVCGLITAGCLIFFLTGDITSHIETQEGSNYNDIHGLILMTIYLFLDAFTSVSQEQLFEGYKISTYNLMLYINIASGIIVFIALIMTDQLIPSILFSYQYPTFFLSATLLSITAMLGQVALYYSIKNFGALFFASVMTTRQIMSIIISCILYFHPVTIGQVVGAVIVFGSLYYDAATKGRK